MTTIIILFIYVWVRFMRVVKMIAIHEAGHAVVCEHFQVKWFEARLKGFSGFVRHVVTFEHGALINLGGMAATDLFCESNKDFPLEACESDMAAFSENIKGTNLTFNTALGEVKAILSNKKERVMEIADKLYRTGKYINE